MSNRIKIRNLQDYFIAIDGRSSSEVYFERIDGYSEEVHSFLREYYAAAMNAGVIVENGFQNPDSSQLSFYADVLGSEFRMDKGFMLRQLQSWLPGIGRKKQEQLSSSIFDTLAALQKAGKNDNVLKNVYIKLMCWLYYKFGTLLCNASSVTVPKILYAGALSQHGLMLLHVLSSCGCDIVLLETQGDANYLKLDPDSRFSNLFSAANLRAFPNSFGLSTIREDIRERKNKDSLLGPEPKYKPFTNGCLNGNIFNDIKKEPRLRGDDHLSYYNIFCRIRGVEDKISYESELYKLQLELKKSGRKILIVNDSIPVPTIDEIAEIKRDNYRSAGQLALGLMPNIHINGKPEIERILRHSFVELILEEGKRENVKMGRLTTQAVYLLCWLKRYCSLLLSEWEMPELGCFFYLGGCKDENEALFCRFLSRLPVDVIILVPDLNRECCLSDAGLFEINYQKSLHINKFPENEAGLRLGTTAFHAEQDLDSILYDDTGMYRNRQFSRASVITLRTMYEEIPVLWNQELKYRPNFSIVDGQVNIPVICSKISGVKTKDLSGFWGSVKSLMTEETVVYKFYPRITTLSNNPFLVGAPQMFVNGKLMKDKIKSYAAYGYGLLREDVQDFILEKIQLLIDSNLIRDDGNGRLQYRIAAVLLNLDRILVRLIQNFDFTKKNPKLIGINTGEAVFSKEDAIVLAFLNLVGFDIVLFVPTGYRCVEQHYTRQLLDEHQIGEYMYDLTIPDFDRVSAAPRKTLKDIFLRRNS